MFAKLVFVSLLIVSEALENCVDSDCVNGVLGQKGRIMGGHITEPNSRPFQVALYLRVGTTGRLGFCGGSLVHREWVLTAAHCCFHDERQVDHIQAILGAHSLYDRYENGRRIVNVDEIVIHPDWDPSNFANDLALLRLANIIQLTDVKTANAIAQGLRGGIYTLRTEEFIPRPAIPKVGSAKPRVLWKSLQDTIDVVRLPYLSISSFNFAGMGAVASGWGIAADGVRFVSPTLREKMMTVMTDPLCNTLHFNQLPDNTICGFSISSGTCKGDNGGPFTIFYNATEEVILIGVASFVGAEGCSEDLPSVFTRVQRYLPWISEVTGITLE